MQVYYYANKVYQLSYALPIYNKLNGVFLVSNLAGYIDFKRVFRGKNNKKSFWNYLRPSTFLNTPPVKILKPHKHGKLEGSILYCSNRIDLDIDYKAKTIYMEHGISDKPIGVDNVQTSLKRLMKYDTLLISSPKNRIKYETAGVPFSTEKFQEIGFIKFDNYQKLFNVREVEFERLKIIDRKRKNILYAPTWRFGNGTFHKYGKKFAKEISKEFNLIVRLHSNEMKYARKFKKWLKKNNLQHVYISNSKDVINADVLNDFVISDLMIGDMSSVVYEFLVTKKPIIIAKHDYQRCLEMADELNIMKNADLYDSEKDSIVDLIKKNLEKPAYDTEKMFQSCFFEQSEDMTKNVINVFTKRI